jgi:hypothetical protein
MDSNTSKLTSSVTTIISFFAIITTPYFLFKGYLMDSQGPDSDSSVSAAATLGYIIVAVLMQIFFNISNAQAICNGSAQNLFSVLMYTFIPNFLILGSVIALTSAFPGWLSPFSNTFGYFFISCLGLSKTFNSLLAQKSDRNKLLNDICEDQSLVINEMTPDNFSLFMESLAKKAKDGTSVLNAKYKDLPGYSSLYKLVVIKNLIAEYIWYMLAGCLVISVSSHSIANIQCEYSTEEMKKTVTDLQEQEEEMAAKEKANKPSLYTVH